MGSRAAFRPPALQGAPGTPATAHPARRWLQRIDRQGALV